MKIIQFVKALLPHIEKPKLLEDLRVTIAELDNVVMPNYLTASTYFRSEKLKSDNNKDLADAFYQNFDLMRSTKQSSFVADIQKRLEYIKQNSETLLELTEELFEHDIISEGLTARKAVLIKASESISFISRFSTDLLNLVYVNEASNVDVSVEESIRLAPIVVKTVNRNLPKYARIISDYGIPNETFKKIIGEVPDVIVNSKTANSVAGLYSDKDLDPFTNSYVVGFSGSPIYHFRLLVAEWQASRYKSNKDKKKMLELRLLHLKLLNDKKNDPKIEQEIVYIQSRVDKIERYLRETEESLSQGE